MCSAWLFPDWIDVWLDVMGEGGGEGAEGG